jgi:hypothetical protein
VVADLCYLGCQICLDGMWNHFCMAARKCTALLGGCLVVLDVGCVGRGPTTVCAPCLAQHMARWCNTWPGLAVISAAGLLHTANMCKVCRVCLSGFWESGVYGVTVWCTYHCARTQAGLSKTGQMHLPYSSIRGSKCHRFSRAVLRCIAAAGVATGPSSTQQHIACT